MKINQEVVISYKENMIKRINEGVVIISKKGYKMLESTSFSPVATTALIKNLKEHEEFMLAEEVEEMAKFA